MKNHSQDDYQNEIYGEKLVTKRRTYYFDVKEDKNNDRYVTLTESRRTIQGQQRNRIFISKEEVDKFIEILQNVASHCKV